jgi:hypothetical protein
MPPSPLHQSSTPPNSISTFWAEVTVSAANVKTREREFENLAIMTNVECVWKSQELLSDIDFNT